MALHETVTAGPPPSKVEDHTTGGGSGQAPVAQADGSLLMQAVGGGIMELVNSESRTEDSTGGWTHTLSETHDLWLIAGTFDSTFNDSSNDWLAIQVNGDTNSNYDVIQFDGTTSTGTSEFDVLNDGPVDEKTQFAFLLDGRWHSRCTFQTMMVAPGSVGIELSYGFYDNANSPLNSIKWLTSVFNKVAVDVDYYATDFPG